jgi:hypothetical protein
MHTTNLRKVGGSVMLAVPPLMKRGEIWLVSLDPTWGHEQRAAVWC